MNKLTIRLLLVLGVMFSCNKMMGQAHWKNGGWFLSDYTTPTAGPDNSTGGITFYVDNGTDCIIGDANMNGLIINDDGIGTVCTITGTVTVNSTTINSGVTWDFSQLKINGILNVTNLIVAGYLTGSGTVNLSAGTFSQTDGTTDGSIEISNLNIKTGNVSFPTDFNIENFHIYQGANVTILYHFDPYQPKIYGKLTIDGNLTNNYYYSHNSTKLNLSVFNLFINTTGSFNGSLGKCTITDSLHIGGSITPALLSDNYVFNFNGVPAAKSLDIFGSANLKFSDLTTLGATQLIYLKNITISGNAKFTADKDMVVTGTAILASGGSLIASGTHNLNINSLSNIDGSLLLNPNTTFTFTPGILNLVGLNSTISYINKPQMKVTLSGTKGTINNCALKQVTVNNGSPGFINNTSPYKIQRLDIADSVTISSLLKNDSINIAATGKVLLTGNTRVTHLVDVAASGKLYANGFLTMLDQSNFYFATDGQIVGNVNIHRKYGSTGWIYFGSPFPNLNRNSIKGNIPVANMYLNKYVESLSTKRWVTTASENLVPGTGYQLVITPAVQDTLVFTGNPTRKNITVTGLTFTLSNGSQNDFQRGYNMVSNPYTAPIDVASFFSDNPKLTSIYYWDEQGMGTGIFVTRSVGGLITPLGSVSSKNQPFVSASYLAPNQGFFVKIPTTGDSVFFKESGITRNLNNNFLKNEVINYIRLNVENVSGTKNDCIIQFSEASADTFVRNLDIYKLISTSYPLEIYSFKNSDEFAIQSRKPIKNDVYIPLGLTIKKNEKHTFSIDNFDALPQTINPYIYDNIAKRSVNLRDSAFSVSLTAGTIDTRFQLILKSGSFTTETNQSIETNQIDLYAQDRHVYAEFKLDSKNVSIKVTDISGRIIAQQIEPDVLGKIEIFGNFQPNNIYIVNISGKNISKISKILIQ